MEKKVRFEPGKWPNVTLEVLWLAVVFVLPLVFFSNIFTTFELAKVSIFKGAVMAMLLLWVFKYVRAGVLPKVEWRAARRLLMALGVFALLYLLAMIFSVAPVLSIFGWYPRFQGLLTFLFYGIFGVIVFFELRSPDQRERLLRVLMASFALVCLVAVLQKFLPSDWGFWNGWNDAEFNGRVYGTMGNPNYLATYIVMMLPLVMVQVFDVGSRSRMWMRVFAGFCIFMGLLTLTFTLSRAGFLACDLVLLGMGAVAAMRKKAKKSLVVLAILPLFAGGFWWFVIAQQQEAWVQNSPLWKRLTFSEENVSSVRSRLEIWQGTVRQIWASPLLGFGPETFAVSFPAYAPPTVNTREDAGEIVDHAHNEPLDFAAQIGIPGALAFVIFVLGLVVAGVRKFLRDGDALVLGLSGGIFALFVANQFGFSVTVNWVYLVLFAGVILSSMTGDLKMRVIKFPRALKVAIFVLVILGAGTLWLHDGRGILADLHMRAGYDALGAEDLGTAATEYREAMRVAPLQPFYSLNFAYAQLQRLLDGENLSAVEKVAARDAAENAALLRGNDRFALEVAQELKKFL